MVTLMCLTEVDIYTNIEDRWSQLTYAPMLSNFVNTTCLPLLAVSFALAAQPLQSSCRLLRLR